MTTKDVVQELQYIKDSLVSCELSYEALDIAMEKLRTDHIEVIKCIDCVYYRCLTIMGSMPRMMCSVFNWQSNPDDFCSHAVKIMEVLQRGESNDNE